MNSIREERYWLDKINFNISAGTIPFQFSTEDSGGNGIYDFEFTDQQNEELNQFCNGSDLRLQIVLLSATALWLSNYSGQELVRVGTTADRAEGDFETGNKIPLQLQLDYSASFRDLLNHTKNNLVEANFYQNFDFNKLEYRFSGKEYNHLFDVGCILTNVQNMPSDELLPSLLFEFDKKEISLRGRLHFRSRLLEHAYIEQFLTYFKGYLITAIQNPNTSLENIVISVGGGDQVEGEEASAFYADTFIDIFSENVKKYPQRIAVRESHKHITYEQLDDLSGRLANYLKQEVISAHATLALFMENCVEIVVGFLAGLKAGMTILPIDPALPRKRIEYILKDATPHLALTNNSLLTDSFNDQCEILNICQRSIYDKFAPIKESVSVSFDSIAYIIYTSGTSGLPKGVKVSQESLSNYTVWANKTYSSSGKRDATFPLFGPLSFDLNITSLLVPLASGSAVVVFNFDDTSQLFKSILEDNSIGVFKITPSHLKLIIEIIKTNTLKLDSSKLHTVVVGGEALITSVVKDFKTYFPKMTIFNEYGPTEATIGCVFHKYEEQDNKFNAVPIGKPICNTQVLLLNDAGYAVPDGAIGEIFVGGIPVTLGYLNNESLTIQKFHKFPEKRLTRYYQTGDLARKLPDGKLMYIGRKDSQLKINGYRIEPEEIENRVKDLPEITEAVVMCHQLEDGVMSIMLFYLPKQEISDEQVLSHLEAYIPGYMLPSYLVKIDRIPTVSSGKIDKDALLELSNSQPKNLPENGVEEKLYEIWQNHLKLNVLGVNDNFYTVGGDSIKSLGLINDINVAFNIKLQVKDLYVLKTIRNLAKYINDKANDPLDLVSSKSKNVNEDINDVIE